MRIKKRGHVVPPSCPSVPFLFCAVTGKVSGIYHNATAFLGCNDDYCCGCYGPVGGKKDYCSKECKPINGGTVSKSTYTWFWVRSALPKRVWNNCMEYKITKANGDVVWNKLVGGNVNPKEGRCGKNKALLNDGIVVVPDSEIAKKVPQVPGLITYRKDNKELYVRSNKTWKVIALEKKVMNKLNTKLAEVDQKLEKQLGNQNQTLTDKLSAFSSIIDRLEKQLEGVNQTLQNIKPKFYDELPSSVILQSGNNYTSQLIKFLPIKSSSILCWRATKDGWAGSTFHSKCNNKGPTITIVRVGNYVFGGYTDISWDSSGNWKSSSNSFIFSLKNKDNVAPFKAPVYQNSQHAIYCPSSYGPTFGCNHDLYISNNANSNTNSYTSLGCTYQPPSGYSASSSNTNSLLAGSYNFRPSEVEVFYLR